MLVYDAEGYFMGATLAELLAREGREVVLVTPFPDIGPYMDHTGERVYMEKTLYDLGVSVATSRILTKSTPTPFLVDTCGLGRSRKSGVPTASCLSPGDCRMFSCIALS